MKQYRLLSDGEKIQAGDEYYHCLMGEWIEIKKDSSIGNKFNSEEWQPFRRLIEPAQPDIPADGEPVVVWDEFSRTRYRRYSTGKINESGLACYHDGKTKWTSHGIIGFWGKWRRPTQEELA